MASSSAGPDPVARKYLTSGPMARPRPVMNVPWWWKLTCVTLGNLSLGPAVIGIPVPVDGVDACLGYLPRPLRVPKSSQRIQGMESLAHVVRTEVLQRAIDPLAVQRQGKRTAVREERGAGVFLDRLLIDSESQGFRRQQRVEGADRARVIRHAPS